MKRMWGLYGYFVQRKAMYSLATVPLQGTVVMRREGEVAVPFSGELIQDEQTGRFDGQIRDEFGASELKDVMFAPTRLSFSKLYQGRSEAIQYHFDLVGQCWIGGYSYSAGVGSSKCFLVDLPRDFFEAP